MGAGFVAPCGALRGGHAGARVRACAAQRRVAAVEIGTGCDLHGQDATKAATRACRAAVEFNSLPALAALAPGGDLGAMEVRVRLGVPAEFMGDVDVARVRGVFPYGEVRVDVVPGGLLASSGIYLPEQDDSGGDDRAIVVVAAVEVRV